MLGSAGLATLYNANSKQTFACLIIIKSIHFQIFYGPVFRCFDRGKYGVRESEKDGTVRCSLCVSLFYRILYCLNVFPIFDIFYLQKHTILFNGNELIPGSQRQLMTVFTHHEARMLSWSHFFYIDLRPKQAFKGRVVARNV